MIKTAFTLLMLALTGAAALAAPDKPATSAADVTLYAGKAAGISTAAVSDWGGGNGQDSTEVFLFGGHSLKVTTLDFYQGAQISFPTPVPLAGDNRVFQLTLQRGGATLHYDPRTTGTNPPGTDNPNGFNPGFGNPGQNPGGNGRRRRRRQNQDESPNGSPAGAPPLIPEITKLRLQFTLADGRHVDIVRPIPDTSDADTGAGWYSINVPVSALKFGGSVPLLKSITLGGDHYGVFFIGRIRMATDTPTLAITIDGPDKVFPGQPVTLRAKGDSGLSALEYSWNLDSGEVTDPSPGAEVTTRYMDSGQDHTVTVTVTDLDGIKKRIKATKVIHVN